MSISVSYTHLDVYKRQVLARPMIRRCYGSIDADVLEAGVLYLRITAVSYPFLAMYNAGAAPVSYTHLDVYKRQEQEGAGPLLCR